MTEIEALLEQVTQRQRARVAAWLALSQVAARAQEDRPREEDGGPVRWWQLRRRRARAPGARSRREQLWADHEAAVARVRELGHRSYTLEEHVRALDADLQTLHQTAQALSSELASPDLRATGDERAPDANPDRLEVDRFAVERDRRRAVAMRNDVEQLVTLLRDTRRGLVLAHAATRQQHDASASALSALDAKLLLVAAAASERDLLEQAGPALDGLRDAMLRASALAESERPWLELHLDSLEQRLAVLDADAAARRAAIAEVEALERRSKVRRGAGLG